ncbi:hypothetical protein ISN45_Aa05g000140 [Arabidopsis thaliana x Arabidopsis arenosa]|uniref:Uncharacterized protein n=1 Tax=Arabidopsis thaliana x Arabidopsis arenosa TaxID=1240361 RepID=A0A8T1ZIX0_9BRAS|nr:hypothetical protein ISN45_Aa05g000140 [Arabidopsis thaliana x Arabidopsis arenosa]
MPELSFPFTPSRLRRIVRGKRTTPSYPSWALLSSEPTSQVARAVSLQEPELSRREYPSPILSKSLHLGSSATPSSMLPEPRSLRHPRQVLSIYSSSKVTFLSKASFPIYPEMIKENLQKIDSNQEIFQRTPKNKETILIRDILSRLQDKWKSSENIAGEAAYRSYIRRLEALTLA